MTAKTFCLLICLAVLVLTTFMVRTRRKARDSFLKAQAALTEAINRDKQRAFEAGLKMQSNVVLSGSRQTTNAEVKPQYTNMPPGYELRCDVQRGAYMVLIGDNTFSWETVMTNRQQAIDRAWHNYHYKQTNRIEVELNYKNFQWEKCQ